MSEDTVKKLTKENKDEGGNRPSSAPADGSGRIPLEKKSHNWNVKSILATWASPYPPKPGGSQSSLQPYQNSVGNTRTFPLRSKLNPGGSLLGLNPGFENLVRRAIRQHKVFCVHPHFPAIRRALLNRGWVEKVRGLNVTISNPNRASLAEITNKSDNETEDAWLLRGLREYPADFVWVFLGDYVNWSTILPTQAISWHPSSPFTSKVGICACLQQSHWVSEAGTATTHFPRCYRLGVEEERIAFTSDFKLTACLGLLKWIIGAYEREGDRGVIDASSHTLPVCVDFAVRQVSHYARVRRHEDVDWISPPTVTAYQWEVFLSQYYEVVVQKGKLAIGEPENTARHMYESSLKALQRVAPFWPQLLADGTNNIWICKPGARNRGIGIVLMNNLEKILNSLMSQNFLRDSNWVVQKYIERPMLVYKTKFDIRQWFIVTDWSPLTVWFYKESYMRFCSKPFSLEDLDESIHLCNNAVQIKYKNAESRDSALPEENMWDNYTFIAYLRTIGKPDLWEKVVYPGMKQAILCVLLSSQEEISVRKNSFELYGADFMLSDNYTPWLIEINSSPCMAPTTSVTARMCNQCLFDLVKVVIDRRNNTNANTGLFELVYKQTSPTPPNYFPSSDMTIKGRRLGRDVDWPSVVTKCSNKKGGKCDDQSLLEPPVTTSTGSIDSQRLTFQELVSRLRFKDAQAKLPIEYVASSSMTPVPPPIPPPVMNEEDSIASVNPSKSMASQTKRSSLSKKHGKSKGNPARFGSSKEAEKETKRNVQFNPEDKQEEQKRTKSADSSEQQRPRPSRTVSDSTLTRPKRKKAHSESPAKKRVKSSDPELQSLSRVAATDATKDQQNDHALKSSPPKLTNTTISKPNAAVAAAKLSLSLDKGAVKPFSSSDYNKTHSTTARGSSQRETNELAAVMNSGTNHRAGSTHSLPPMTFQSPKPSVPTDDRSTSYNSTSSGANVKELKQVDVVTSKENAKTSSTASKNKSQSVRTIPMSLNLPLPTTTSKVASPFKPRRGTGLTPQTLAANRFKPKAPNTDNMAATLAPIAEEVKTSDPDSAATKTLGSGYRKTDTGSASGGTAASADFHRPRPTTIFASEKNQVKLYASGNARNIGGPSGAKAQNPNDKIMESNANPQVLDPKLAEMSSSDKSQLNKNDNS